MRIRVFGLLVCLFAPAVMHAQIYHVREMNVEQIRALDRSKTAVILPGGILEEHGPYLPIYADGYVNERLTQQLADAIVARPGWSAVIFPVIPLGAHGANVIANKYSFPSSFTVRASTVRAVFMDLADQLGEQGFRWVFIVHSHGAPEHNRALDQAAEYFRDTYGGHMAHLAGFMSVWGALDVPRTEKEQQEDGFTVHSGMMESSLNLFLCADRVSPAYKEATPYTGGNIADLVRIASAEGWPGYFGSPRLANAAYGAAVWKSFSEAAIGMALRILDGYDYTKEPRYVDVISADADIAAVNKDALAHDQQTEQKQQAWLRKKNLQ